ncbi:actinia tenebrosa protease inhibitors-like [Rhinoraja longicauda]
MASVFATLTCLLLCAPLARAGEECMASFNVSQGFSLEAGSLERGASLLDSPAANSSAECRSHCCSLPPCSLALFTGDRRCLLIDCPIGQTTPACTLHPRPGFQASFKPGSVQHNDTPAVDCSSPPKTGPCRAAFTRWFYNATEKVCQEFIFGGCLPNLNNYDSAEDCLNACDKPTEPSNNQVPVVSRSVMSLKDCSKVCSAEEFQCNDGCCIPLNLLCDGVTHCFDKSDFPYCDKMRDSFTLLTALGDSGSQSNERCTAPKAVGYCRAAMPRWNFDPKSQKCSMFIYGGCKGNKNNYETERACLQTCAGQKDVISKVQKLKGPAVNDNAYCLAPAVTGRCRAAFPRWYYDSSILRCRSFTYGGCGGNKNNYDSVDQCLARCSGKTGAWNDGEDGGSHEKHQAEYRRHVSAISMVVLLAICVFILLSGVVYFIVKLAKSDHVVSYHRTRSGDDKDTLINAA